MSENNVTGFANGINVFEFDKKIKFLNDPLSEINMLLGLDDQQLDLYKQIKSKKIKFVELNFQEKRKIIAEHYSNGIAPYKIAKITGFSRSYVDVTLGILRKKNLLV